MPVYMEKKEKWTKDGRKWYFKCYFKNAYGENVRKRSKLFLSKNAAAAEERKFLLLAENHENNISYMTFEELEELFFEFKADKVREGSLKNYKVQSVHLIFFHKIKLKDLNINHIEKWQKEMNGKKLSLEYKNDILTLLKQILNYGQNYHHFHFDFYKLINDFKNPNDLKKEMDFYTLEEYKKFIDNEDDLSYITLFDTLYYLGLRKGELRGLQWKDIDFSKKTMSIKRQIASRYDVRNYKLGPLKTKASYRDLPINKKLLQELELLYNQNKNYTNFENTWFVFGNVMPISNTAIFARKRRNAKLANLREIRVHDFRHSCASLLINNGANVTMVAKYLGHSKIDETLNTYSHMFQNKLNDIINIIENL